MVPLVAEIRTEPAISDHRAAVRRTVRLGVPAYSSGDATKALILNLSETGLLIETSIKLAVGETLQIDVPESSESTARVVWTEGLLVGCEFVVPVSKAAVIAAQLQTPIEAADSIHSFWTARTEPKDEDDTFGGALPGGKTVMLISLIMGLLAVLIFLAAVLMPVGPR